MPELEQMQLLLQIIHSLRLHFERRSRIDHSWPGCEADGCAVIRQANDNVRYSSSQIARAVSSRSSLHRRSAKRESVNRVVATELPWQCEKGPLRFEGDRLSRH